jgi:hypothetical protein
MVFRVPGIALPDNDDYVQGSLCSTAYFRRGRQNRSRIAQATLDKQRLQTQQRELQNQIKLQGNYLRQRI